MGNKFCCLECFSPTMVFNSIYVLFKFLLGYFINHDISFMSDIKWNILKNGIVLIQRKHCPTNILVIFCSHIALILNLPISPMPHKHIAYHCVLLHKSQEILILVFSPRKMRYRIWQANSSKILDFCYMPWYVDQRSLFRNRHLTLVMNRWDH